MWKTQSRCGQSQTNWIHCCSMTTKRCVGDHGLHVGSQKDLFRHFTRIDDSFFSNKSVALIKACQDLQWNHDTSTPHRSETNKVEERTVLRVKASTSLALVHGGFPDGGRECHCYLRHVHDKMADGKTDFEKRFGNECDGPHIPYKPRTHQIGKENAEGIISTLCLTCGERLVRRLVDGRIRRFTGNTGRRNLRRKNVKSGNIRERTFRISVRKRNSSTARPSQIVIGC